MIDTIINNDYRKEIDAIDTPIELIVCDPPYDISVGGSEKLEKQSLKEKKYDNEYCKVYKELRDNSLTASYDIEGFFKTVVLKLQGNNVNCYFFCNKRQISQYFLTYVIGGKCKFNLLIWHKKNALPTYFNKYLTDCEYLLHFYKGNARVHPENYQDASTIFEGVINMGDKKKWGHPTIKPLELVERIIRNSSKEGDTVFDPFMGSGTTAIACLKTNRHFIGCEINEKYYEICKKRIMEEIQKKAFDDELNKSNEEIGQTPRKFIPVPKKLKRQGNEREQRKTKNEEQRQ